MWQCYWCGDGVIPQATCLGPLKLLRHHPVTDQATLTEFLHLNFACSAVLPRSHFLHSLCHGHGPEIFGCLSLNFLLVPSQSQNLYLRKIKMLVQVQMYVYTMRSSFVQCHAVSLGKQSTMFQWNILPSSSGPNSPKRLGCFKLKMKGLQTIKSQ